MTITKAEVQRLVDRCLVDGRFERFLQNRYASYDGFWSFLTSDITEFAENAAGKHGKLDYERAVWQAMNFTMFPTKASSEWWNEDFVARCEEDDFDGCFRFVPEDGMAI